MIKFRFGNGTVGAVVPGGKAILETINGIIHINLSEIQLPRIMMISLYAPDDSGNAKIMATMGSDRINLLSAQWGIHVSFANRVIFSACQGLPKYIPINSPHVVAAMVLEGD